MGDDVLSGYMYKPLKKKRDANYISMKALNFIIPNDEGMEEFNRVYNYVLNSGMRELVRTKSNGISIDRKNFFGRGYSVRTTRSMFELLIIKDGRYYKIHFKQPTGKDYECPISGTRAFDIFVEELAADGIDINELAIDNGMDVKKEIESPMIALYSDKLKHRTIENAHHIDFHSSHPAGMAKYYPQLRPTIERIYWEKETAPKDSEKRKINKAILNETWGYLQAAHIGAKWAHISRDAIHDTNERLLELAGRLIRAGRQILAFNTDGIWYSGDIYHGEGEGTGLGEWGHDHVNCVIRFRSKGCYEFIEDGVYHPVVRGWTALDQIKNRESEWVWGDIYNGPVYRYKFIKEKGVVKIVDDD